MTDKNPNCFKQKDQYPKFYNSLNRQKANGSNSTPQKQEIKIELYLFVQKLYKKIKYKKNLNTCCHILMKYFYIICHCISPYMREPIQKASQKIPIDSSYTAKQHWKTPYPATVIRESFCHYPYMQSHSDSLLNVLD